MRRRVTNAMQRMSCIAVLAVPLLASSVAIAREEGDASYVACAQRETLLMMLVEAHGAAPNVASDKLSTEANTLGQMRTACDNGRANEALAFYDRLNAELTTSITRQVASIYRLGYAEGILPHR